jgi:hypothetical protein
MCPSTGQPPYIRMAQARCDQRQHAPSPRKPASNTASRLWVRRLYTFPKDVFPNALHLLTPPDDRLCPAGLRMPHRENHRLLDQSAQETLCSGSFFRRFRIWRIHLLRGGGSSRGRRKLPDCWRSIRVGYRLGILRRRNRFPMRLFIARMPLGSPTAGGFCCNPSARASCSQCWKPDSTNRKPPFTRTRKRMRPNEEVRADA